MIINIKGKPIPLARARAGKKGFYDPQYQAKQNFAWEVKRIWRKEPLNKAIKVNFYFYIGMPKSWSKKKRAIKDLTLHDQTPDLSNLIKFVEDALNDTLWKDDKLIGKIKAFKRWSNDPRTIIEIAS